MKKIGSRAQVMHGNAEQTSGGLMKKSINAKKEKRLENAGYKTKKGVFGFVYEGGGEKRKIESGTPVPGTPVPGTPVLRTPNRRSSYPPNLKKQKINVFNLIEKS